MAAWNRAFSERIRTKASTYKSTVAWRGQDSFRGSWSAITLPSDPTKLLKPLSIMGTENVLAGLSEVSSGLRGDPLPGKDTHDSIYDSAGTSTLLGQPLDAVSSCSGKLLGCSCKEGKGLGVGSSCTTSFQPVLSS